MMGMNDESTEVDAPIDDDNNDGYCEEECSKRMDIAKKNAQNRAKKKTTSHQGSKSFAQGRHEFWFESTSKRAKGPKAGSEPDFEIQVQERFEALPEGKREWPFLLPSVETEIEDWAFSLFYREAAGVNSVSSSSPW
ncbi:hypothetical protein Tco_0542543 [Tanacetum coccineum]